GWSLDGGCNLEDEKDDVILVSRLFEVTISKFLSRIYWFGFWTIWIRKKIALEGSALLGSYYAAENVEDPSLDENLGANLSASSFPSGPGAFWEGIARITLFISSSEKGPPPPYLYGSKRYQR
ncbi:hypothetical protein ACJX0J_007910, partial [Zea mays]